MPKLTLVPTPIGNLQDITLRALDVLRTADLLACEDTRHSGVLLKHFSISKPLVALHMHNEHKRVPALLDEIVRDNKHLAYLSDAGTPGISDPGFLLVREALAREIPVEALPGATAFVPALVGSGLPMDRFVFEGFLPQKKGRQTRIKSLAEEERTMVFYESPHRIAKVLGEFSVIFGPERPACVCRELTKLHEEMRRGTLAELQSWYDEHPPKGECVVVVGGKP